MSESPTGGCSKLKYVLLAALLMFNVSVLGYFVATQYFGLNPLGHGESAGNIFSNFFKDGSTSSKGHGWVTVTDRPGSRVTDTLKYFTMFTRHGSRGPVADISSIPYSVFSKEIWPDGHLQLTKYGRCQMYNLGRKIRTLYNGFLSKKFLHDEIKVHSTNTDRTLMTAQLVLAGLYPPVDHQVWNNDVPWQPVPVYTTEIDNVEIGVAPEKCPAFYLDQKKYVKKFGEDYKADIDNIKQTVGNIKPMKEDAEIYSSMRFSLFYLWELLHLGKAQKLTVPEWTKSFYPEPLKTLMAKFFVASHVGSEAMIRLTEGQLFTQVMKDMERKINGELNLRKMQYYSAHDFTILGVEAILGLFQGAGAEYVVETGSALILELHENPVTHQYNVKVLYIDGASEGLDPAVIGIPNCSYPCDFYALKSLTEKYFVHNATEWKTACENVP